MTRVLTFGTFDSIHDGHRAMLKEAKALGDFLIAVVAPDNVVAGLKGCVPQHTASERISMLKKEHLVDDVVLGDEALNTWKVIKKYKPTIIALGYDQHELKNGLEEFIAATYPEVETEAGWQANPKQPKIVTLKPFKPETHHSRLLKS
jgi:cytidyltransferase-like protein